MQDNNRNLILAIVLSVAIILLFQVYFTPPKPSAPPAPAPNTSQPVTPGSAVPPGTVPGSTPPKPLTREEALRAVPRVAIDTPRVQGSISLVGGIIDDITLRDYRETTKPNSANVHLLKPSAIGTGAYYVHFGWSPTGNGTGIEVPSETTRWSAEGGPLAPGKPVTLSWTSKDGLRFVRRFEIDRDYLITVTEAVENAGAAVVQLAPYAVTRLVGEPTTTGFFILHEGPIAVFRKATDDDGIITDPSYDEIKDKGPLTYSSHGGWLGFTDHYWLVALLPDQKSGVKAAFRHTKATNTFQADYLGDVVSVAPGGRTESVHRVFAGAKEVKLLRAYEDQLNAPKFEWAIDFGWFWFFTKPFLDLLIWLYGHVGNFGIAIMILTVLVKLVFFPLANKSYKSMAQMKKLQPEMMRLRERYANDKQKMNQELMGLYRKERVNPAAGCLPILLQIPVFFALYKVLFISIEMRHAPFYGWIQDLSAPDPTSILNLFGLLPYAVPRGPIFDVINIGVWPLIMGVTMWLQHKLNPASPDPVQRKVFALMPIMFTFMLASFPAGLVIYWAWNNVLSIGQQWLIMKNTPGALAPVEDKSVPRNIKELEARKAARASKEKAST
jgi:YidC/Oxa1 family membrane protein insertase